MKEYTVFRSLITNLRFGMKALGLTAVGCLLATTGLVQAQSYDPAPKLLPPSVQPNVPAQTSSGSVQIFDPMVTPASGCSSCGGVGHGRGGCANGRCGGDMYPGPNLPCVPGRKSCFHDEPNTVLGRFFGCLCDELCCPDP